MAKKAKREPVLTPSLVWNGYSWPLEWDGYSWTSEVRLRTWAGFQNRRGPYASRQGTTSDGTARLAVHRPGMDDSSPPDPEQERAFRYLVSHEKAITDSLWQDIFDAYPEWRDEYLDAVDEEAADDCPDIDHLEQLKPLMGLATVHILTVSLDGMAYVGFEFGCEWESEHGLGVMTHGDRIVSAGHADNAFLEWIARDDIEEQKRT